MRARLGYGMCLTPETLSHDRLNQEFLMFIPLETESAYVSRVMARGHLSVTEHASFTFAVEGVKNGGETVVTAKICFE